MILNLKVVLLLCVEFSQGHDESYLVLCAGLRQCIWTLWSVNSRFKLNSVLLFAELCNNCFIWFTLTEIYFNYIWQFNIISKFCNLLKLKYAFFIKRKKTLTQIFSFQFLTTKFPTFKTSDDKLSIFRVYNK